VKILSLKKSIFSWRERATKGSSFHGIEKRFFDERLKRKAGNSFKKIIYICFKF